MSFNVKDHVDDPVKGCIKKQINGGSESKEGGVENDVSAEEGYWLLFTSSSERLHKSILKQV